MPQNRAMPVGQLSRSIRSLHRTPILSPARFILSACVIAFLIGCSTQKAPFTEVPRSQTDKIYLAIARADWPSVLTLSEKGQDPLLQIVHQRALYELKRYENVLSVRPLKDLRFGPYDIFLRSLSAFEAKRWDDVLSFEVPNDLPSPIRERMLIHQGEAHHEKKELQLAENIFSDFLKKFKNSALESDVMFRLADIELSLGKNDRALELYEKVYRYHPVDDSDDIARRKLLDAGRFDKLDTDVHLARIQRLQRAARFKRAQLELEALQASAPPNKQSRIQLAVAQLHYSQRNYSKSQTLAEQALKTKLPLDLEIEWRQIFASSLVRHGSPEEGQEQYRRILNLKIPPQVRETVVYKLAMLAIDNQNFKDAAEYFDTLRKKFPHGNYIESAYWFGAWAVYEEERHRSVGADLEHVKYATKLLDELPTLPKAKAMWPQALYWKASFSSLMDDHEAQSALIAELQREWPLSFHTLLTKANPFYFLREKKISMAPIVSADFLNPDLTADANSEKGFYHELSWQRLESFRSVNLKTWGKMELDRFVENTRRKNPSVWLAVAKRFQAVEDWSDLVRWSEKYFDLSLKNVDLKDPIIRFHYPRAYPDAVLKAAEEFNISPFLIWGVMREESRFETDVISRAGAVGLLQVMPAQANRLGALLNEPVAKRGQLSDGERNIRYGAFHLSELQKQVDALPVSEHLKPVLQVAAYNAGIDPVARWIKEKDSSRTDDFVESIPYAETRFYVKRVLQSAHIYYQLYGKLSKEVALTPKLKTLSAATNEGGRTLNSKKYKRRRLKDRDPYSSASATRRNEGRSDRRN